jgi:hypothetical protein
MAVLALVLCLNISAAQAQGHFRPGADPADGPASGQLRDLLDAMGLLRAEPEPWTPLPEVRAILDELAANGDLQDDILKASWEELNVISDALSAGWADCIVTGRRGIQTQYDNLGRLGEDIRDRMNQIANIREGVAELYLLDVTVFEESIGELREPGEIIAEGYTRMGVLQAFRGVAHLQGGSVASVGGTFLRRLGVLGLAINLHNLTVVSFEAFRAYERLPHLMEKAEMIAYLDALRTQYSRNLEAINVMIQSIADTFPEACPCLPSMTIGEAQIIDPDPESIERRIDRIGDRLLAMRESGEFSGHRFEQLEQELEDLVNLRIAQAREQRRADREVREQNADSEEARRRHKTYLDQQQ